MHQRHPRPALTPPAPTVPPLRRPLAVGRRQAAQPAGVPGRTWPALRAPWHGLGMLCLAGSLGLGGLAQAEPAPAATTTVPTTAPAHHAETGAHAAPAAASGPTQASTAGPALATAEPPSPGPAPAEPRLTAPAAPAPTTAPTMPTTAEPAKHSLLSDKGLQVKALAQGVVSYYANFFSGRSTANGERFDQRALTMAHRSLPFGTLVRVVCLRTERSVVVRVNDRGPFVAGRVADLSRAAAEQLNMLQAGLTQARLEVLGPATPVKALPRTRPAAERPTETAPRR